MIAMILMLCLFSIFSELAAAHNSAELLQRPRRGRVALPVMLDSMEVFMVFGADSISARAETERVEQLLSELRATAASAPERLRLREQEGDGVIMLDSLEVLVVRPENRIDPALSPLANALAIREQVLAITPPAEEKGPTWDEEELLLRLLLGMIYPFSLLVVLRLTRTGIRRWERDWHKAMQQWLKRLAQRRGLTEDEVQSRRIINFLTGIERLLLFGAAFILLSFTWFALFPQTQPLATSLLARIIGPAVDLLGGTARGVLLIGYTALVVLLAYWLARQLLQRRRLSLAPGLLVDPVIYFPLRIGIWIVALFFILFPYPGTPRLFAVGVLLITLLATLIALRPLIEEIATGIYLNSTHAFKAGDQLTVDGAAYHIITPGLIQLVVQSNEEQHWLPYSRLLKADLRVVSLAKGRT